jgi:hypothetical protein
LAEYWYNTSSHSALKTSPFVALYGQEPRHWGISSASACNNSSVSDWLNERKSMQQLLQSNLNYARQQMKKQADKKRTDRSFTVADHVFIKLQPYAQSSTASRSNNKLAFKYFGPYSIKRIINPTAFEVALPPESKIHPVFHVSQLRKALLPGTPSSLSLPTPTDDIAVPVKIQAEKWTRTPSGRRARVQVQWSSTATRDITWEDKLELEHRFPAAPAWGQAATQGGGDVSNPVLPDNDMGFIQTRARPKRLIQPNRRHVGPEWTT